MGCRFGVPELVLSRNRPPSSLAPGKTPVRTPGTAEGRGPGRRLPSSGGQQGPGSGVASPRPRPAPIRSSSAASASQARRPSAHPARGSGRLTYNPRVGPSRSTKATLKVFSNQRRLRLRDLAPRRACAPVAPERECARCRASEPARSGPPTVRLSVRVRRRPRPAGDQRGLRKCADGLEGLSAARRRRFSRERVEAVTTVALQGPGQGACGGAEDSLRTCAAKWQCRSQTLPPSGG